MEFRPIVSALLRNKTGAVLVILQIGITMAVIVNALFIINQRLDKMNRETGMDIDNMIAFQNWGYHGDYNHESNTREKTSIFSTRFPVSLRLRPAHRCH